MARSTRLCIVRHGETDWNISGILQGWIDVPLNERGHLQARELGASFAHAGFSGIWSSPLSRARSTAEIIAGILRLPPPLCHEGLKERHFGAIQGIPKSELADLNPVLLQQILKRNPAASFEGGESMGEFAARVLDAIVDIGERHPGTTGLAITHGWVMDVITRHIGQLPRNAILPMKRKNGECLWLQVAGQSVASLA
jgi:probable phosphoglycerate mutase